jgi:GNAT superfamily N-acetyltransferase
MCGGNAPAETNPYCARSWLVICVTAAHVLGSGLRNTPKRNWLSTSVRPSLIPHDTVGQQRPHLWLTVTKPGHCGNKTRRCSVVADLAAPLVSVGPVSIEIRPATIARFDDVAIMIGPKSPNASVCWCLSHRLDSKTNRALVGPARGEYVKKLSGRPVAPGVLAYDDIEVVGWAAVAPRSELPFARSTKIPHVDQLPIWSVWCIRVRPGHRGKGISHALLDGAVAYARSHGAPAVEGYPVDNKGKKVDLTMAYVGTRKLFEEAGFTKAADTRSVSGGFPRVVMRLDLR